MLYLLSALFFILNLEKLDETFRTSPPLRHAALPIGVARNVYTVDLLWPPLLGKEISGITIILSRNYA